MTDDGTWGLADVACVCGRNHTMLTPLPSVKAHESRCFLVCPDDRGDDDFVPCSVCSLHWRERLRKAAST